ncbi:endonuclease/exonuclease/phosphatase family protein [Pseudooctadecabacter sp.]|uniref:endonuclease/exonuclease/phosphatase family protein n=1 Tax=Pseudooctadecabacter sp. TaxID=1966338 RepID=UPI0025F9D59A|nr:endonuclease/exonuclease/phosphatase family protein [Pseudooctadecabacter sp.]
MWQTVGRGLAVLGAGVVVGSFAGDLHPIGDSLAVFRAVWIAGTLAICAFIWRSRTARVAALVCGVAAAVSVFSAWNWTGPEGSVALTVYQKNMKFRPADRTDFIADVLAQDVDIVTLQEVSRANQPVLEALRAAFPYQLLCNGHRVGAVAILSKTPLTGTTCGTQPGFARAATDVNGTPVQVVSLHLHWPWPYNQARHVADLLPDLAPLEDGPTVVGGDFNMVADGRSVAAIERATGTARVGPRVATFELYGFPLGIDHVLATGGLGVLSARPLLGADHYGLVARIAWP